MALVIDSSIAACWFLPDEFSALANRALEMVNEDGMVAPVLLRYEIQNVLLMNERRKRIAPDQVEEGFRKFGALPITYLHEFSPMFVAELGRRHELSGYDAAYLDVAIRRGLPLATLDQKLAKAGLAEGLEVITDHT